LTRWQVFQTFRKSLKNFLIEREGGFLPPSLFPRCSVSKPFSFVFDSLTIIPDSRNSGIISCSLDEFVS
jgi:hypothetical protein